MPIYRPLKYESDDPIVTLLIYRLQHDTARHIPNHISYQDIRHYNPCTTTTIRVSYNSSSYR